LSSTPVELYATPIPDDYRQGDIYHDVISLSVITDTPAVLRTFQRGNRTVVTMHHSHNPPAGGFRWQRESVEAIGKKAFAIVLTHDCEIDNDDDEHYRQVALIRPLSVISEPADRQTIVEGGHIGRLYLPPYPPDFPESYIDLRAITTLRRAALPPALRLVSLTDHGRKWLQSGLMRYFTEKSAP
jgi:hypothetical protein